MSSVSVKSEERSVAKKVEEESVLGVWRVMRAVKQFT